MPTLEDHLLTRVGEGGFKVQTGTRSVVNDKMHGANKDIWGHWLPLWAQQMARNYPIISQAMGVQFLSDAAKGIPAIVVGIGPSLDGDMEWLSRAGRNAILISTDAALRPLQAHGIDPHIVIQLDCKAKNVTMFEGLRTDHLVMVASSCIHPDVIHAWKGRFLFYNHAQNESEFTTHILPSVFPHIGPMDSKATVGNMGVLLAHKMGCSRVIVSGMDMCYQPRKGQAPVEGAKKEFIYRATDYAWVEGTRDVAGHWEPKENKVLYDNADRLNGSFDLELKGKRFRVDHELDFYRKALLEMVGESGMEFTNCAVDGILQDFVETIPLEKALMDYCQPAFSPGQTVIPHLVKLIPMEPAREFERVIEIPRRA